MIIVLTTTPTAEEAETLARRIVEARLAACVQIVPQIKSVYYWETVVQTDYECLLLIKTLDEHYASLEQFIAANHSYETPEITALSAQHVADDYLKWLAGYVGARQ